MASFAYLTIQGATGGSGADTPFRLPSAGANAERKRCSAIRISLWYSSGSPEFPVERIFPSGESSWRQPNLLARGARKVGETHGLAAQIWGLAGNCRRPAQHLGV